MTTINRYLNRISLALPFALLVLAVPSIAFAASDTDSVTDLILAIYRGVMSGHYVEAAAVGLVLGVVAIRKMGFARSGLAAAGLVVISSLAGAISTALAAGATLSMGLVWTALQVAVMAAGGYSLIKQAADVIRPLVDAWRPSWYRSLILLVLGITTKPAPSETSSTRAETQS